MDACALPSIPCARARAPSHQETGRLLWSVPRACKHTAVRLKSKAILGVIKKPWPELPDANLELGVHAHRASIKVLSSHIERIERKVLQSLKPRPEYQMLLTVPGIGPVIAWTIVLETGDLSRFASVGHFASYCRCVDSKRTSNEKKKGENNVKNGNAYLAWAFFEAAHFAIQYLPAANTMRPYAEPSLCWVPLTGGANHRSCLFWTAPGTESCLGLMSQGQPSGLALP